MAGFNMKLPEWDGNIASIGQVKAELKKTRDYLFMLNEQLRYQFSHIDADNIIPGAIDESLLDQPLLKKVQDTAGNYSLFRQTVKGIGMKVADVEGNLSELVLQADGLLTRMENAEGDIGTLEQRADSLQTNYTNLSGDYSAFKQTAEGFHTRVENAEGDISQVQQTAQGLRTDVTDAQGNITSLQQTAQSLRTDLTNAQGDITTINATTQGLTTRVQGVEDANTAQQTEINQNKTAITAKADKTVTDGLNTRLNSAEQKITPDAITTTVRNHAAYKGDLAGKNRTFVGGTPTGMIAGDLWIDSANDNLLKRWNGSEWVSVQDGAISLAQQQADKIQWLVASGDSGSNMTLTSQLYSLMAANIDLSANNSIRLAVSGGTNLWTNTDFENGFSEWFGNMGTENFYDAATTHGAPYVYKGKNLGMYIPASASGQGFARSFSGLVVGEYYTISFNRYFSRAMTLSIDGATPPHTTIGQNYSWGRASFTFKAGQASGNVIMYVSGVGNEAINCFDNVKLEKGTMATDWSPSPSDPASGVKTSSVEVNSNGIYMDTTGTFNVNAGVGVNIKGGTGTNSIGISNNDANNYFLWAGHGTPASAPFSVKRDGSVKATKIQHEMPYTFWDMADSSTPAEFPVYIPSGYTIDSVTFTFQTKKARTFAKSAKSGGGSTQTSQAMSGGATVNTGNTGPVSLTSDGKMPQHNHLMGAHWHRVVIPNHEHGLNYGINEKPELATSCDLKVGATTIGTYSPNPSNPVEIKAHMSAGWNTVIVAPNDDARIVAFALVKLTPA